MKCPLTHRDLRHCFMASHSLGKGLQVALVPMPMVSASSRGQRFVDIVATLLLSPGRVDPKAVASPLSVVRKQSHGFPLVHFVRFDPQYQAVDVGESFVDENE
jgi:hypothetical protein